MFSKISSYKKKNPTTFFFILHSSSEYECRKWIEMLKWIQKLKMIRSFVNENVSITEHERYAFQYVISIYVLCFHMNKILKMLLSHVVWSLTEAIQFVCILLFFFFFLLWYSTETANTSNLYCKIEGEKKSKYSSDGNLQ